MLLINQTSNEVYNFLITGFTSVISFLLSLYLLGIDRQDRLFIKREIRKVISFLKRKGIKDDLTKINMKIVFSSNISWSIYNFRGGLLKELQKDANEIFTVALEDQYSKKLKDLGFVHTNIKINNNSKNPIRDLYLIHQYYKIYKSINPDVICHNAIKPNIYGTIAAGLLGIPTVNNISGLGTLFIKESFSTTIAKRLYKFSQKRASKVFFQNMDDLKLFVNYKLISPSKCKVIPGSGVDTNKFLPKISKEKKEAFNFLFVGRLLYDKGILEYINAIKILKVKYPLVSFDVLGPFFGNNATSVDQKTLNSWVAEGMINYLGETDNVQDFMGKADCIVLPSYREGLSKVLIEASSLGVPIVTTNVPGCRDVVVDNETGFLCKVKNATDLALKMEKMLNLKNEVLKEMSAKARDRAVNVFDEKIIINHYKEAIYSLSKL